METLQNRRSGYILPHNRRGGIIASFHFSKSTIKASGMREGFSLIELIFVIILIGILSALAIPRFFEVGENARKRKIESFVMTFNSTIAPMLWSTYYSSANGSIKSVTFEDIKHQFEDWPEGIRSIDLSRCANGDSSSGAVVGQIGSPSLTESIDLYCIDGNASHPPRFGFDASMSKRIP